MASSRPIFNPDALSGAPSRGEPGDPAPHSGAAPPTEREFERALRPARLADFVGQEKVVSNLRVAIEAARGRGEPLDHVLLSGPPGLGKTSLARILAQELGHELHATTGPALQQPRDLIGLLTQLQRGDVLFIDEVHRVPAAVEEYLYTAMEDFSIEMTIDQGPHARAVTLAIKPFTLVGATTREGLLSAPFRGRFGLLERVSPYPTHELVRILVRSAGLLGVPLGEDAAELIAGRSRGSPRFANRFLRRARDLAQVNAHGAIDAQLAAETLERLGVDEHGLGEMDRRILECIARQDGMPVGIKTIAAAVDESEDTIEEAFEPHLLRMGFVQKTPRGRVVTASGLRAIGLEPGQLGPNERGLFP